MGREIRRFYDIVLVGTSLGTLAAGALLAQRGFRVLSVRHDDRSSSYQHAGLTLQRTLNAVTYLETAPFKQLSAELGLGPTLRRRVRAQTPPCQVALPQRRIDVHADLDARIDELTREFPDVRRSIKDFYERVERERQSVDHAFVSDVLWPPEGFFERRAVNKALAGTQWFRKSDQHDPLSDLPARHPFRTFVRAGATFMTRMDPDLLTAGSLLRLQARLVGSAAWLVGGADAMVELLLGKIVQYGGEIIPRDRIERVVIERKRVVGVDLAGTDERVGCSWVITGLSSATAMRLASTESDDNTEDLFDSVVRGWRFVVNLVVGADCVPEGMTGRIFHVMSQDRPLEEENLLCIETLPADVQGRVVLSVCCSLPRAGVDEGMSFLHRQRERVRTSVREIIPFLNEHVLAIDSPHDGRPFEDLVEKTNSVPHGRRLDVPEPMEPVYSPRRGGFLGSWNTGTLTAIKGLLLSGPEVCPALGEEGELLSGLTVARRITRKDGSRERMRRDLMWSKPEI